MKAKNLFKKSLAWMLTLVLIVLAVPMAAFVASAEATSAPTPDSTDIGKYVDFYQSTELYNEYKSTGSIKTNAGEYVTYGDNYTADGTYYASVKMTFDPYFEYAFVANEETGKWERGAGNAGIVWGQTGIKIGTYVTGDKTSTVSVVYRKGQRGFYLMDAAGTPVANLGAALNGGGDYTNVALTVKYDSAAKLLTAWIKGDDNEVVATDVIDMSAINEFVFGGFDLKCGNGGAHPADMNDITNTEKVKNYATFSDLHIWGNVYTTKSFMTPSIGNNKNLAEGLTLSDPTANADWKADGEFTWNFNNTFFNGMDFIRGAGQIVYASVTMSNLIRTGGNDIYGVAFATVGGKNNSFNYVRPSWNQQGVTLAGFVSRLDTEGWGNAGGDGTFKNHNGDQVVIYAYDVDNGTVDIWLKTAIYQSHNPDHYIAPYQDIYVGKYSLGQSVPVLGLVVGPNANLDNFTAPVTVKDVKVWTNGKTESLTSEITLSDPTLDAQYQTTGQITINSTTDVVYLNDVATQKFVGQKVYYYFTAQFSGAANAVVPGQGATNPAMVFAADASGNIAGFGHKATWNQSSKVGGITWNNIHFDATGSGNSGETKPNEYLVIYDVDAATAECWMNIPDRAVIDDGWLKMATATINNGYTFKLGISGRNVTGGTLTVSNIAVATTKSASIDTTNKLAGLPAYVGGQFVGGHVDKVLVTPPAMNAGTEVDTDGVYVTTGVGHRAKKTIVWKGLDGNLNDGAIIFEGKLTLNPSTDPGEIHNGFIPCMVDGQYVAMGLGYHSYNSKSDYFPQTFINAGNMNEASATQTILGGSATMGSNIKVEATNAPGTADIMIVLTSTSLTMYVNGTPAQNYNLTGKTVVPTFGFVWSSGNAADTLSDVKIYGSGVSVCSHAYDNDMDEECNKCGIERVAPGKALPTIGENTNFVGNLVFDNPAINAELAENGTITTSGLNGKANGVLLGENGVVYIKTDIAFNGNVDHNWSEVKVKNEETGEMEGTGTYAYSNAWGRTGVQIGTYYSTGRETRMSVYVTYRRCTGGVYVWDNAQEVNGSENPVVVGNIAADLAALSLVVRYDSVANNVTVWADGAYVGTVSLEAFGEFAFALGVTQYGSGTTAVDPSDNTNPEATPNSVTFSNIEVWGDLTATCVHEYDNDCDADCNKCGEGREVEGHVYDDNCADVDCNKCGTTRPAAEHVFDDCTDTTCANCAVTREAADHVFDDDCQDTTCANCSATREPADHVYDDDCQDTTCANCGVTRPAAEHVFDDDCQDTTCANCSATREPADHVYDDDCQDTTCANCGVTRPAAEHVFDNDCQDTTCANCSATREAADHVYDDDCQDTTCANCGVTRPAAEHVFDNDCQDTTCANCSATREAADHVYENACDATCANCAVTRPVADHVYDDEYDPTCNVCGYEREVPERPSDIVIGSGDTQDKLEVVVGEVLPVLEKVGTKFVLGWTNSLGEVVTTYNGETDLVAEYVETLMMTVKYQVGTDGDSIRYIASVDQTERYTKVGWAFSLVNANPEVGGENVVVRDSSLVYQGLLADGQVKTAADIYGGADYAQYLYVFEITDIPEAAADSIIYVRPYVEMNDGTIVYGEVNAESLNTIKSK